MAAANTDKLRKGFYGSATTLSAGITNSATTIPLSSTVGLPTDTAIDIVIDRVDANGVKTPSKQETVTVVISGSNGTNAVRGVEGSAQAHSSGAVVEVLFTADTWNDHIDNHLVQHNQDGTHGAITATGFVQTTGTFTVPASSIVNAAIADTAVTPAKLLAGTGTSWPWQSWTPTYTSITVGNGTVVSKYTQIGKTVIFKFKLTFGTTTSIAGNPQISIPVTAASDFLTFGKMGDCTLFDTSASSWFFGMSALASSTLCSFYVDNVGGTFNTLAQINATTPFVWATGDVFYGYGTYEAA